MSLKCLNKTLIKIVRLISENTCPFNTYIIYLFDTHITRLISIQNVSLMNACVRLLENRAVTVCIKLGYLPRRSQCHNNKLIWSFAQHRHRIIGHLFYIISSFVHHLKPLSEFKLELLSGNAQFWSKWAIFCPVWPWNLMDDLEKNRAPLLCYIKLCASFQTIGEFKLELEFGNAQFGSKLAIYHAVWPWN